MTSTKDIEELVELIRRGAVKDPGKVAPYLDNSLTREKAEHAITQVVLDARIDELKDLLDEWIEVQYPGIAQVIKDKLGHLQAQREGDWSE